MERFLRWLDASPYAESINWALLILLNSIPFLAYLVF